MYYFSKIAMSKEVNLNLIQNSKAYNFLKKNYDHDRLYLKYLAKKWQLLKIPEHACGNEKKMHHEASLKEK